MNAGDICTRDAIIIYREDSALEAARLMRQYHVGDVIVVDRHSGQNVPVGIITDRDIVLELVAKEVDAANVTAGDIMSKDLLTTREDEALTELIQKMQAKGVRRAPVLDDKGGLVGIVSKDDLIELIGEQLTSLVTLVNRGEKRESTLRT